ncbi:MAG TPA: chromosomal replication initiator protein DnaA [Clostridia bacterium]
MSDFEYDVLDEKTEYDSLWAEVLQELETTISAVSFDVFIKTMKPLTIKDEKLVLVCETNANKAVIVKNYQDKINAAIAKIYPHLSSVIITSAEKDEFISKPDEFLSHSFPTEQPLSSSVFNPKYTFDTFVVGKSNQFVHAAARAVTENTGNAYNPLFIYGGVGLGKTHIMHAVGNYITSKHPELKVLYVTCERFMNELIDAIRLGSKDRNSAASFRNRYRNIDILMVDDIQFIANKTSTQEEFFHTFNDLYEKGKQIIISSDRPPKEINPLEERLRSRFEWGLIADIQPPDYETRLAILQKKAMLQNYNISDDVLAYIAEQNDTNVRVLEENLTRVYFHAKLFEEPLTVELAAKVLRESVGEVNEKLSIDAIIDTCCRYYKVTREDLFGKKKNKEIVYPRQMCIYLITEILSVPLTTIGQIFGGRDHTTIMYARDKIASELKNNPHIKTACQDLRNLIYKK